MAASRHKRSVGSAEATPHRASAHHAVSSEASSINDSNSGRLFCFRWHEHNHEIATQPTRQGFGTTLLTRLVPADLSGRATLDYASGSFRYELEVPVEAVIEQESNAVENVKGISTMRVIRERPDPKESLA